MLLQYKRHLIIAGALVILLGVGFAYYTTSHETFQAGQQQQLSEAEVAAIIESVSKHILLPRDEEPMIAIVGNAAALIQTEPFYTGAENGDLLLFYPNAGKAILYSQENDILINVGPIVLDQGAQSEVTVEETPQEEPEPSE